MANIEIGGNFCLSQKQINEKSLPKRILYKKNFLNWSNLVFTHGGRSAIIVALKNLGLFGKDVLLPNFICHSIIDAFSVCGCRCFFYKITRNLNIDIPYLFRQLQENKPAILFLCSFFGFDTLADVRPRFQEIEAMGVKIIEDVTHSLLHKTNIVNASIVVCSTRKWLEIPDGGFVSGMENFNSEKFYTESPEPSKIVDNFVNASKIKFQYLKNGDEELKKYFLPVYYENNNIFDKADTINKMSAFSYNILTNASIENIARKRRENYSYLLENINNPYIQFIFNNLPDSVVPLYLPVYIRENKRNLFQKYLIAHKLYCPIIWPTPDKISVSCNNDDISFHDDILSLVIDQRYDMDDMERLVNVINKF